MSDFTELLARTREEESRLPAGLTLTQETAEGLDLSDLEFHDAALRKCRFIHCDFSGAAFFGCRLENCDFSGCRLPGSFWRDCRLSGCKADGADFRRSRLKDTVLEQCLFRSVPFTGGRWDRLAVKECNFTEAILSELRLSKVTLEQTDLTRAELFRSGMNIGRDAMGTMANTLILAFAGASLNMLILFRVYDYPLIQIANTDAMAVEVIRGVAGSIGIVLTVPLVALLSSRLMGPQPKT